ncbi:MAG: DMT family transporter [Clostridia bacterium]|nr:DMT family transporter [Clostridia bacterium]
MKKLLAPGLLLLASIIWGFAFPAQKMVESVPPMAVIALRSVIATLFLFPMVFVFDRVQKNERRFVSRRGLDFTRHELVGGGLLGVIYGIASGVQQMGLTEGTDGGKGAFISALYVVIVPLIGLFLGRRPRPLVWGSIGLAVVGFYLLCIKGDFTMTTGDLLILLCALIFAFHILTVDHFSPRCDGVRMSLVQFFVSSIVMTILSLIFEGPLDFSLVAPCILPLLYLGIGSSGVAYTLQIIGQKDTPPAVASILLSLESVFGVVGSVLLLGERMTLREGIGSLVVFSAVVLAQLPQKQKASALDK